MAGKTETLPASFASEAKAREWVGYCKGYELVDVTPYPGKPGKFQVKVRDVRNKKDET